MAAKNPFDCQSAFLVVTGASRGIGRTIAVEFSRRLPSNSVCLLMARSKSGLEATKAEAEAVNSNITYYCKTVDLAKPEKEELNGIFRDCLSERKPASFDHAIIVHNVGSVGDVSESALDMGEFSKWQDYFSLNVFSVAVLNTVFLKIFNAAEVKNRLVINISSICGVQPLKYMGYYCSGKAAREMYFKVLAKEDEDLTVLNYAPGPVETEMFDEILHNSGDKDTKKLFTEMRNNEVVLTCHQTTSKLVRIVAKGDYSSGDHLDYYEINY